MPVAPRAEDAVDALRWIANNGPEGPGRASAVLLAGVRPSRAWLPDPGPRPQGPASGQALMWLARRACVRVLRPR